ncbi:MAG: ABC transporter ATP-binding protein/permease [Clostridia bacterium]|nr:ABC transporter ATP-binding protein/permease [Clostridia bacterium]MBR3876281.1 ABC transporter ATP-binding protein/permease [Clostridia bacterium]
MINITSLNKIYKSKKRGKSHALKNINLSLPDAGLVFVLGKSGSGKSTLLNLIGGLDNITSGTIEVDGNNLADFKEKDFCNYRNTHIGFIFQDYHLIDELTVYENIILALDLRRIDNKNKVKAALERVGLSGYEDRYPSELSGGEQQRVAIARAIVKDPRIILADEPTGNLDTHTAGAIIKLLQELAHECLILIVSHNVNDAETYADRIVELSHGQVIRDEIRNSDFAREVQLYNGVLLYPAGSPLSDSDIKLINRNCNKNALLLRRTDKFLPTPKITERGEKRKIKNKSLKFKKELALSGKFLKRQSFSLVLSSFMVAVIIVIMSLSQTIISFDSGKVIVNEMKKESLDSMMFIKEIDEETKVRLEGNYRVALGKDDEHAFYKDGYQGDVYPIINYTVPITSANNYRGKATSFISSSLYISETLGTMTVDEDFLAEKFGEIKYLAKKAEFSPIGVIITDYVADILLKSNKAFKGQDYDFIVNNGVSTLSRPNERVVINAIIDTDYTERHKSLLDRVASGKLTMDHTLFNDTAAGDFLDDIYDRLGYCYTLNENFLSDFIAAQSSEYVNYHKLVFNKLLSYNASNQNIIVADNDGSDIVNPEKNPSWRYTARAPEIPDGARYIRVCHAPSIEKNMSEEYDAYKKGYATLCFEGYEPISEEKMNFAKDQTLSGAGEIKENQNSRYLSDYIEIPKGARISEFFTITVSNYSYCAFYDEDKNLINTVVANSVIIDTEKTVVLNYSMYNEIFGTNYSANTINEFVPHPAELSHHMSYDVDNKNPLFTENVYIGGLTTGSTVVSPDLFTEFYEDTVFIYAFYLNGTDGLGEVIISADEKNYSHQSSMISGIESMTRAVEVFVPIFELIAIFLYIGVIFILMNFSSKVINDKMHEIGILKAIGTKNKTVVTVFGLQIAMIFMLTCLMSTLGYYFFIDEANDVLIESLRTIVPNWIILDLDFLTYSPAIALKNCILVLFLSTISMVFPMIKIKAIKPVKIIKAKE